MEKKRKRDCDIKNFLTSIRRFGYHGDLAEFHSSILQIGEIVFY